MGFDLGGGRRLVLAVGEEGWLWPAAGLAAVVLLLGLYRAERRLVPRSVGRVLLALRGSAALALVLALMEPMAERSWTDRIEGRLVVGVDLSASMATTDDRRPAEERRRLRQAEGLAPEVDEGEHEEASIRRSAIASRILRGSAVAELARGMGIDAVGFARSASMGTVEDLAGTLDRIGDGPIGADRRATDWGPVLERALESARDGAAPVLGVVLLTDGRRNAPSGGVGDAPADRLAALGVPVVPVLVGSTVPPRDAAVSAVRAPASAFEGDTVAVLVEVKLDGFAAGSEVPVTLEVPGAGPLREVVRAAGDGTRAVAAFRVPLNQEGPTELVASVDVEAEGGPDDRPENDRRSAVVRVGGEPARVLLVDAEARWEFRYLKNALARDRRVALDAVLLAPPPPSEGSEPTYASSLPPAPDGGSEGPDPINAYEVIILGDVPPELAPAGLWGRLDAFVADRGGTLIVAAGPRGWPSGWSGEESAMAMLPVVDPGLVAVDPSAVDPRRASLPPGVSVVPDVEAGEMPGAWPMLQFAADPGQSRAAWEGLAPLSWALSGRAKPGASALLVVDGDPVEEGRGVVVAAQPFGLGKVLWVGTDGTWRWRLRVGDAYHHRFWGQVVRWAAEGSTAEGNRLVRFGPDRPELPEGAPVPLRAEFSEEAPGISPDLIAAARIFEEGGGEVEDEGRGEPTPIALVPLHPSPDRPRTFEASAPALPSGRYRAVLDVPGLADAFEEAGLKPPEATFEVAPEETDELIELAADRLGLDRLASITGGRVLRDFEAGQLPRLIPPRAIEETRTAETPLWDTPVGLLAFFGLMGAEWVVRKRSGLP